MTNNDNMAHPRLLHWVIAATIIFLMGIIVPLFAAFL
jgi:hypothetical protein